MEQCHIFFVYFYGLYYQDLIALLVIGSCAADGVFDDLGFKFFSKEC